MIIALTGTPGCGKTAVAQQLAEKGFVHIELNRIITRRKLYSGYDKKRKTWIADINKVEKFIKSYAKKYGNKRIIIDSHISHLLPAKLVDVVIVLRCSPGVLEKRLEKKHWNKKKIIENKEAEIIGLISWEARKKHKKVFEIDATNKKPKQIADDVRKF